MGLDYRMAADLQLGVRANISRIEYELSSRSEDSRRYTVSLDKQWSRHWSTSLSYYRYERDSSLQGEDVSQNVWYASIRYRNR